MDKELIAEVIIPKYIRKVMVSKSRRPSYYYQGENIPSKYENQLGSNYQWVRFQDVSKAMLCDANATPIIKNKNSVGTAKYKVINGQDLHTCRMADYERKSIIDALKEMFTPYVLQLPVISKFPIKVRFDFYEPELPIDLDNFSIFYTKTFFDTLVDKKIIPDDSVKYVDSFACNYIKSEDSKLVIKIFYENRN